MYKMSERNVCRTCNLEKELTEYGKTYCCKTFRSECIECSKLRGRNYYKAD